MTDFSHCTMPVEAAQTAELRKLVKSSCRLNKIPISVGLSNICYTVLDEIMECIFWRFPSKRAHWEAVIISIIISFELYSEIFKREETMRGIKAFVILAMTAFYFPIVSWGKGTNLFVLDA